MQTLTESPVAPAAPIALDLSQVPFEPYYEDSHCTIYNADCMKVLPFLPKFDLLLTDPPYGIGKIWKGGFSGRHGWGKSRKIQKERNKWDESTPTKEEIKEIISTSKTQILWGGNYFELAPKRGWIVWIKPERGFSLSEAELAWTNIETPIRVYECRRYDPEKTHPTQKPIALMRWCLSFVPNAQTILDPFLGSGTTLVAAKLEGKRAVGIEISEKYCESAAKRLEQGVLF